MSFVVYDTETTGLETAFDQILQFAAIRTDDDLNEVDRFEVRSRLLPFVIPSPGALKVTGQTLSDILHPERPSHYDMVRQMRAWLENRCPSVFLGYNSTRFDENLLRQAFYQCLHPPYLTNTKGSRRADVLTLVQAAHFLAPELMTIPKDDKGKASFKLDRVAPANGFAHDNAHDALADVEATLHLARLIKEARPDIWGDFLTYAVKSAAADLVTKSPAFFLLEHYFGRPYPFAAACVGESDDGRVLYCLDLNADLDALRAAPDATLAMVLAKSPKRLRRVKPNAPSFICPVERMPPEATSLTPEQAIQIGQELRGDSELCHRLTVAAKAAEEVFEPSMHVEEQIYEGFWSDADDNRLAKFHDAPWADRLAIVDALEDKRLRWLGRRLIYVESPECLAEEHRQEIALHVSKRMLGLHEPAGKWMTLQTALEEAEAFLASGEHEDGSHLHQLRDHFIQMVEQAKSVVASIK